MGHTNGHLQQLAGASQRSQWIGWVIIAGLFSITLLLGSWIKAGNDEAHRSHTERLQKLEHAHGLAVKAAEVELKNLNLALITERGRVDAQAVQINTMIGFSTRIEDFMRNMENRLTRMEITQERREQARQK